MMPTRHILLILFLWSFYGLSQPVNDLCVNAVRLCANTPLSGTTTDATSNATDYDFCYTPENTVWFIFTTNSTGGSAAVAFTNLNFNTDPDYGQNLQALFFKTGGDCGVTPYTPMSSCGDSNTDFAINDAVFLTPNTTYYVQVSGSSTGALFPSECDFDITLTGSAVVTTDPSVTISSPTTNICQGADVPITESVIGCEDLTNYEWFYDGSSIYSGATNDFSTADLTEDGSLYLTITCGEFCSKTSTSNTIDLTVTPVSAEAGEDQFIDLGEQADLLGSGVGTPTWSPGSSLTSTTTLSTIATPENTITYYLTMENGGCFATDSVTVYVGEILTIFTAFSPNGDNINDRWHIVNSEKFPNMEVNVYDRSGQQVFSAVNYTQEDQWWDGTFKGKLLPTSTYYYVIQLNDSNGTEYKGYVNIIR